MEASNKKRDQPAASADDLFPPNFKVTRETFEGKPAGTVAYHGSAPKPSDKADPFTRKPGTKSNVGVMKEVIIPAFLILLGWAGYSIYACIAPQWGRSISFDVMAFTRMQGMLGLYMMISVALTTLIGLIAAPLAGVKLGGWGRCLLRMAAITIFPWAISQMMPVSQYAVRPLVAWMLLSWLFDLDLVEAAVWGVMIFIVQIGIGVLLIWLGMSMAYNAGAI